MKSLRLFPLFAVLLLASACGPTRYTAADVNLDAIDEFAFFQPYAFITGFDAENQGFADLEDARVEAQMITGIINSERYPFTPVIPVNYEDRRTDDLAWVTGFPQVDPTQIARMRVPRTFRKLLDESGCRYGVVIYANGFIRSKEFLQREALVRGVVRILDKVVDEVKGKKKDDIPTYTYIPRSEPYGNRMYLAVIDAETDRVVSFVKESSFFDSDPMSRSDVTDMVHRLLKDFVR